MSASKHVKVRRPPEPRLVAGRYVAWYRALLGSWRATVTALAVDGLDRLELERAWAHLTDPARVLPVLRSFALQVSADSARYYRGMFKRTPPRANTEHEQRAWLTEQVRLLESVGADQIARLLAAQTELSRAPRADAKASVTRAVNAARKANVALIGGTDLKQHVRLVDLFKTAQATGTRHENMIDAVQSIMGIGETRAKLIARDQTVKHNAAVNEANAQAAGFVEYTWRITRDNSCRPMHRALDGKRFRYDSPPVTNKAGDTNNPGEDYNCRCQAEPVPTETQDLFAGLSDPTFEGLGF